MKWSCSLPVHCWIRWAMVLLIAFVLAGCGERSELSQLNARQLSAEEQGNLVMYESMADWVAAVFNPWDKRLDELAAAKDEKAKERIRAKLSVIRAKARQDLSSMKVVRGGWTTIPPNSMSSLNEARSNLLLLSERISAGQDGWPVTSQDIYDALSHFRKAEREFRKETASRPLQGTGSSSPSVYVYVTLRGAPLTIEITRGELFLGPTVPLGPVDVNPVVGPFGEDQNGPALKRLLIRDPATGTQRAFALNDRVPEIMVPKSIIKVVGTDLAVTALLD